MYLHPVTELNWREKKMAFHFPTSFFYLFIFSSFRRQGDRVAASVTQQLTVLPQMQRMQMRESQSAAINLE